MRVSLIESDRRLARPPGRSARCSRAILALLVALPLAGCLRVRETFELAPDLSGRVTLEVWVPSAFLPGGSAGAGLRLGAQDLVLPPGVELRRHAVDEDLRTHEVRFELALSFGALEQLRGVSLRYPGAAGKPGIHPWRGLVVQRGESKVDIDRAAYGTGEISAELLASVPEGRLAAESLRWTSVFAFDPRSGASWIAPRGGWQSLPGSARTRWSRIRSWGDHLRAHEEPLRALLPLSFGARVERVALGSLRGLASATPWIALALWLVFRRSRRGSLPTRVLPSTGVQ